MNDAEIREFQKNLWERYGEALEANVRPESLTPSEAALVRRLSPEATRLLEKIFRAVYVVAPSDANRLHYLKNRNAFVLDLALYSVRFERKRVCGGDVLTPEELNAIPEICAIEDRPVDVQWTIRVLVTTAVVEYGCHA